MSTNRNNKDWSCCFGIHVRTATIAIGVWHLLLNLLSLGLLAVITRANNQLLLAETDFTKDESLFDDVTPLPTTNNRHEFIYNREKSLRHHVEVNEVIYLCMIGITMMLIYGAIKGKPSNLLPFLCLQIFDLTITTLTAAGYLCYLQSVHKMISANCNMPICYELMKLKPQAINILVFVVFFMILFFKAYAIRIIWECYKFLTVQQINRSNLPYFIPEVTGLVLVEDRNSNTLPNYQELAKEGPPTYEIAMAVSQPGEAKPSTSAAAPAIDSNNEELPTYEDVINQSNDENNAETARHQ